MNYGKEKSGRTTRFVDNTIQNFFKLKRGEKMVIYDHSNSIEEQVNFRKILTNRLVNEHPLEKFVIDKHGKTICRL